MAKIPSLQTNDPNVIDTARRGGKLVSAIAGQGRGSTSIPSLQTSDPDVVDTARRGAKLVSSIAGKGKRFMDKSVLGDNAKNSIKNAEITGGQDSARKLTEILERKASVDSENSRRRQLFRRFDNLFHARTITVGGADHWSEDQSARLAGRAHVSVNVHPSYVSIPASLQAVRPVINYLPSGSSREDREEAAARERIFFRWWEEADMDIVMEDAALYKSLYGDTAAKITFDEKDGLPRVEVISAPENLYMGYGSSDYTRIDWALYHYGISPQAVMDEFGVDVVPMKMGNEYFPFVYAGTHSDPLVTAFASQAERTVDRRDTSYERMQISVYDYWYKKIEDGKTKTFNCLFVGNEMIKDEEHPEYDGELPYIPLINSRIPGSPYGKPELYDVEQLLREKDERITNAAQFIHQIVGGQMFQLVGQDAPEEVPANAIPKPGRIAAPGAGNRIEPIQPFLPNIQIEQYNQRIDRELAVVSGLNDLLLGIAPSSVLGSSRAIASLVANYEQRIAPKRKLFYNWIKKVWKMSAQVWSYNVPEVALVINGNYRIEIVPPELTPRDTLELANTAISLVQNRIWSAERAMDRVGVDDPQNEKDIIRDEQTDATINPAAVATMASVVGSFRQLGLQQPEGLGAPNSPLDQNAAMEAMRGQNPSPMGSESMNDEDMIPPSAAETMPENGGGAAQTAEQMMSNMEGGQQ